MSCARLKHSLTVPAYSEQRSTLAELGLGRKSTPAVASVPATGAPAAKEQVETSPQIEAGPSFQPAVRTSLPAPIAATTAGSTVTWSGPSCARLSKAHALRGRPSGLVEHACGRQRVRISGYRVRLLRRVQWSIQFAVALLDPSSAEMALHSDPDMVRPIVGARQVKLLSGPTGSQCQDALA